MIDFVKPFYADQHLTDDDGRTTLCGLDREDVRRDIPFWRHTQGFVDAYNSACVRCADAADRIQNGPKR